MPKAMVINTADNVATAIADIQTGEVVSLKVGQETKNIEIREEIPFGHKFALGKIEKGEGIIKYGEKIGRATQAIEGGFHVHVHNVESLRGRGDLGRLAMKLVDQVALVTGAGSGIGQATAIELAREGADIAANYFHSREGAEETCRKIKEMGRQCITIKADVTKAGQVEEMVRRVLQKFGKVDILVNNSGGIIERSRIAEMSEKLWDDMLDLNFKSVFLCSKAVIPHMVKSKSGVIINLSSIAARNGGGRGAVSYAATKAGVDGFTKGLAKELVADGIRVNAIAPGIIDTPFHKDPDVLAQFTAMIPMKRLGKPEEAAKLIVFLASNDASYITGRVFDVSGGIMI